MGLAGLFASAAVDFGSDPFVCPFPKCPYGEAASGEQKYWKHVLINIVHRGEITDKRISQVQKYI